jgi:hypothetical protein
MNEEAGEIRLTEIAVECSTVELANKNSVLLKTKRDLLRLAKMLNRPVLHWKNKWIIIEGDTYFQFEDEESTKPNQSET